MRLPRHSTESSAELRTVQVVEGGQQEVAALAAALRKAGCRVESVVKLGEDQWEVTARSTD
jgi:hypothetical protein